MDDATLLAEAPSRPARVHGLNLDTCKGSLLHVLTRAPGPDDELTWRSRVATFILAALIFGGTPLALVAAAHQNFWTPNGKAFAVPLLRDYNALWTGFVTLPLLITLLRSERALIPQRLASVHNSGMLKPRKELNTALWEKRFRTVNVSAQLAGLCIGFVVAAINYHHGQTGPDPLGNWIIALDLQRHLHPGGWWFLVCLIGLLWFLCTVYVARAATTLWLLWSIVGIATPYTGVTCWFSLPAGPLGRSSGWVCCSRISRARVPKLAKNWPSTFCLFA